MENIIKLDNYSLLVLNNALDIAIQLCIRCRRNEERKEYEDLKQLINKEREVI